MDNKALAIMLMRISFGINYAFHGIVRIPNLSKFVAGMEKMFEPTPLPIFTVTIVAYIIPFLEIVLGLLLILNKFTRETIIAIFALMNVLIIGSCFAQKWDIVGQQTMYLGFLFLLLYFMRPNDSKSST